MFQNIGGDHLKNNPERPPSNETEDRSSGFCHFDYPMHDGPTNTAMMKAFGSGKLILELNAKKNR